MVIQYRYHQFKRKSMNYIAKFKIESIHRHIKDLMRLENDNMKLAISV